MTRSQLFMATLMGQYCWVLVAYVLTCWSNYVQVPFYPFRWCRGQLPVRGLDSGRLDPMLDGAICIDHCWGRHLRARCCPCIIECIATASIFTFCCKTLCIEVWTKFVIIKHLWFVCVYLWILASPRILWCDPDYHPLFYDGGVTVKYVLIKVACSWSMRKMEMIV
jgi:hypothetical protein